MNGLISRYCIVYEREQQKCHIFYLILDTVPVGSDVHRVRLKKSMLTYRLQSLGGNSSFSPASRGQPTHTRDWSMFFSRKLSYHILFIFYGNLVCRLNKVGMVFI